MSAQAAIVVTAESGDQLTKQYFDKGAFVLVQGGQPSFGVDREGNCWFIDRGTLVSDSCEEMLQSVSGLRDQALAGLGPQERAMLQQVMALQNNARPANISVAGNRTIAGYAATCYLIGGSREICLSERLMGEVRREMGSSRFIEMYQRFGDSAANLLGENPEAKAMADLAKRGFPMSEMHKGAVIPGLDPAMLNYLPEAQRNQLVQQLGAKGGGQMQGTRVVSVDIGGSTPVIDLGRYPRMGFTQYLQKLMGQMGAIPSLR